jgi:hypothetical protein
MPPSLLSYTRQSDVRLETNGKVQSDKIVYEPPAIRPAFLPNANEHFENRSAPCQQLSTSAPEISRRQLLNLVMGAAALPAFAHIARAETYPSRPVRIIVGFPPGARPISRRA